MEKILSYGNFEVLGFDEDDLLIGADKMTAHDMDFNDGVSVAIMMRIGVSEAYSNDSKHLGRLDSLRLIFE